MNLIKFGEKYFDEVEISTYRKKEIRAEIELNQISMSYISRKTKTVIRGISDKRLGIYVVDGDGEEKIKDGIEKAYKMARMNRRDERWISLPQKQSYGKRTEINEGLKEQEPEFFVNILLDSTKRILREDPNAVVAGGESGSEWVESMVMNSHAVEVSQENVAAYFYLYLVGKKGNQVTPGIFDMDVRRDANLDTDYIVSSLLSKLKKAYNVVPSKDGKSTVILEPFALSELIEYTLLPSLKGDRKVKGTSYLQDKLGERVLNERITLMDDPWHPLGVERIIADDEGVASRRTEIFRKGKLESFLWDNYWGKIEGVGSTGNGYRDLKTGGINIAPHNLVLEPGHQKVEDIISGIKEGYFVSLLQGAHSSNPDTGDFSVVANPAFKIENGEIVGSTVFMLSGNIISLLNRVEELSSEQRRVYALGRGIFPYVKFYDVKIASVSK